MSLKQAICVARLAFETAVRVFDDPYGLSVQDRIVDGEARWQTIGLIEGVVVLLVAHTVCDDDPTAGDAENHTHYLCTKGHVARTEGI